MNVPLLPGRIEHWPLARLKPYARNAKTHDADQVAKIAASMAEFGWTVPVLVAADGELIAGHGRILASPPVFAALRPAHPVGPGRRGRGGGTARLPLGALAGGVRCQAPRPSLPAFFSSICQIWTATLC